MLIPSSLFRQKTLARSLSFEGIGLHSGEKAHMILEPADENTGFCFIRTDLPSQNIIQGSYHEVSKTHMCTQISNSDGHTISTIEHLTAALSGVGITNAMIQVAGPEIPIMDGSAQQFLNAFTHAGVLEQKTSQRAIRVLHPISVSLGSSVAFLIPSLERRITMYFHGYGRMNTLLPEKIFTFSYDHDFESIAPARTFGFYEDGLKLQKAGFARGASLDNTIVIHDDAILNPEGLRSPDEFLKHKVLDAIGDLSLSGYPILGHFIGVDCGHNLNNLLLKKLFTSKDCWDFIEEGEV